MELAIKIAAAAGGGAIVGLLISRARQCSSGACRTKVGAIFTIVSWAVFAGAVAWFFLTRGR